MDFLTQNSRLAALLNGLPIPAHPPRTLNIGCGTLSEGEQLAATYPNRLHIGLDFDGQALRQAPPAFARIQADARYMPLRGEFALILVRHPDVIRRRENWTHILTRLPKFLAADGVLLVTVYALMELDFVRHVLPDTPLSLGYGRLPPPDLIGRDRFFYAVTRRFPTGQSHL